ncbi:hypothetical protein [Campylobacter pinnipediorum]|uniref:hypothetical protein n=1 Tax=Campylobacter pinnipediorum TaxID=1965231 RepID=UPI0015D66672|nr:hypothetical protein [Campylobacter pinnipediorum]
MDFLERKDIADKDLRLEFINFLEDYKTIKGDYDLLDCAYDLFCYWIAEKKKEQK